MNTRHTPAPHDAQLGELVESFRDALGSHLQRYEFAAIKHGETGENAREVDDAADALLAAIALLATPKPEAAGALAGEVTRHDAEQFLVAYHAAVWETAQSDVPDYEYAGHDLAKAFLDRFGEPT